MREKLKRLGAAHSIDFNADDVVSEGQNRLRGCVLSDRCRFYGSGTAPITADLLRNGVITSKEELALNLNRVQDRPSGPTGDTVFEDRSLKFSSAQNGPISEKNSQHIGW